MPRQLHFALAPSQTWLPGHSLPYASPPAIEQNRVQPQLVVRKGDSRPNSVLDQANSPTRIASLPPSLIHAQELAGLSRTVQSESRHLSAGRTCGKQVKDRVIGCGYSSSQAGLPRPSWISLYEKSSLLQQVIRQVASICFFAFHRFVRKDSAEVANQSVGPAGDSKRSSNGRRSPVNTAFPEEQELLHRGMDRLWSRLRSLLHTP